MLSHTKLINALKLVREVSTSKYIINELFDNTSLIDSEWVDYWKNKSWGKPTRANAITYSGCTSTKFKARGNDIIIELDVWDGDNMYGNRTQKRCIFTLKLEYSMKKCELYKYISSLVEGEIGMRAIALYNKELQDAKNKRVNEILQNIIGSL